jgi:hypothetical protein
VLIWPSEKNGGVIWSSPLNLETILLLSNMDFWLILDLTNWFIICLFHPILKLLEWVQFAVLYLFHNVNHYHQSHWDQNQDWNNLNPLHFHIHHFNRLSFPEMQNFLLILFCSMQSIFINSLLNQMHNSNWSTKNWIMPNTLRMSKTLGQAHLFSATIWPQIANTWGQFFAIHSLIGWAVSIDKPQLQWHWSDPSLFFWIMLRRSRNCKRAMRWWTWILNAADRLSESKGLFPHGKLAIRHSTYLVKTRNGSSSQSGR